MLKNIFLYRKSRISNNHYQYKKTKRHNNVDLFSYLPIHQSMHRKYKYSYHCINYNSRPLEEFIKSKIGEDWNDVYSEIIKKIKPKFRYLLESDLMYIIRRPLFNDEYIPLDTYYNRCSICSDRLYVDFNNIICYKSKDEILIESKRTVRKIKLQQIFDNKKENQSSD